MTVASPWLFEQIVEDARSDHPRAPSRPSLGGLSGGDVERRDRYGHELLAVPAIRKDGRRISLEFSIVLLRDERGELAGAGAIIRDVTARWERERASRSEHGPATTPGTPLG